MTNVTSDMVVAVLLDSFAKRGRAAAPAGAAEAAEAAGSG
jgi:hypothetical protein